MQGRMAAAIYIIAFFLAHIAGSCGITVRPAEDAFIAENSLENVTYTCEVAESLPEGVTLLWEIRGEQIWSAFQVERYANSGVFIENHEKTLLLVVTPPGRRALHAHREPITVSCTSYDAPAFKITEASEELQIHQFGAPGPVVGLELTFHSETELRLQWSRPAGSHPDVSISYVVNITNTATDTPTLSDETMETYVLVSQRGNEKCQPHSFSVTAMNDAGSDPVSTIMDSIPISPSVDVISESQTVDRVLLTEDGAVNITLSYPHAEGCSESYPVVNYTVDIAGSRLELSAGDYSGAVISITISSHENPAITRGQRYSVVIGACNLFTCRSSNTPLTVVTGDVQAASVVFYMRSVIVDCTLTEGSPATDCLAVFTRYSDSGTENVTSTTGICPQLTQTRGAYEDKVLVYSIGPDGSTVQQPITASVVDTTASDNLTCSIPEPTVSHSTTEESEGGSLSGAGAIAGVAIGGLVVLAIAAVLIILAAVAIRSRMSKRGDVTDGPFPLQSRNQYQHIGRLVKDDSGRIEPVLNEGIAERVRQDGPVDIFWTQ